jgi:hypothetical protein
MDMPQWLQNFIAGWPMIAANLPTFAAIVVIIIGAVWAAFSWSYGQVIRHKDGEIRVLERQISANSALSESTRPKLPPDNDFDPETLAPDDKQAYGEILDFCLDYLLPACQNQMGLQEELVNELCDNKAIATLAISGLRSENDYETGDFWRNYQTLSSGMTQSPGPIIGFDAIIDCIFELEQGQYRIFCEQSLELRKSGEATTSGIHWAAWRDSHNALVDAYEPIKRDPRFGKLLRPGRPSRWGNKVIGNAP